MGTSGTAIVGKAEGASPLPPPARTEGARGRGGGTTSLDYRLTQGENRRTTCEHVGKNIEGWSLGLLYDAYLNATLLWVNNTYDNSDMI